MKSKMILYAVILFSISAYCQPGSDDNIKINGQETILRSYLNVGIGRTDHYLNLGAGFFLPIGKNIIAGPRANANFEVNAFQRPAESSFDLEFEARYAPFISRWFLFQAGAGVGYFGSNKRGKLIGFNALVVPEYEKVHNSSISAIIELDSGFLLSKNFGITISGYSLFANKETLFRFQVGFFLCKILDQ